MRRLNFLCKNPIFFLLSLISFLVASQEVKTCPLMRLSKLAGKLKVRLVRILYYRGRLLFI